MDERAWNQSEVAVDLHLDEKSPNFSVEAVFKQVDIKSVPVQVDLFKLVDVDVDTVVFRAWLSALFYVFI